MLQKYHWQKFLYYAHKVKPTIFESVEQETLNQALRKYISQTQRTLTLGLYIDTERYRERVPIIHNGTLAVDTFLISIKKLFEWQQLWSFYAQNAKHVQRRMCSNDEGERKTTRNNASITEYLYLAT